MAKIIHAMYRVSNLERSINFYKLALGLEVVNEIDFTDFTLVYLKNDESNFEIELTFNKNNNEPYTQGTGYGHIAVAVDNLEEAHERLQSLNFNPKAIKSISLTDNMKARFFFVTDPDGYEIEFLAKGGRFS